MDRQTPEAGKYYIITTNDERVLLGRCAVSAHGAVVIQNEFIRGPDGTCCVRSIFSCHEVPAPALEDGEHGWLKMVNQSGQAEYPLKTRFGDVTVYPNGFPPPSELKA